MHKLKRAIHIQVNEKEMLTLNIPYIAQFEVRGKNPFLILNFVS